MRILAVMGLVVRVLCRSETLSFQAGRYAGAPSKRMCAPRSTKVSEPPLKQVMGVVLELSSIESGKLASETGLDVRMTVLEPWSFIP